VNAAGKQDVNCARRLGPVGGTAPRSRVPKARKLDSGATWPPHSCPSRTKRVAPSRRKIFQQPGRGAVDVRGNARLLKLCRLMGIAAGDQRHRRFDRENRCGLLCRQIACQKAEHAHAPRQVTRPTPGCAATGSANSSPRRKARASMGGRRSGPIGLRKFRHITDPRHRSLDDRIACAMGAAPAGCRLAVALRACIRDNRRALVDDGADEAGPSGDTSPGRPAPVPPPVQWARPFRADRPKPTSPAASCIQRVGGAPSSSRRSSQRLQAARRFMSGPRTAPARRRPCRRPAPWCRFPWRPESSASTRLATAIPASAEGWSSRTTPTAPAARQAAAVCMPMPPLHVYGQLRARQDALDQG